jgi:mannose-6-phosphate isomerase-like protein (cupin superfamily)
MSNPAATPTPLLVAHGSLPATETAVIFTGAEHGPVPVSLFLDTRSPGSGPGLHRHAYPEVFVIHSGRAAFQLGDTGGTAASGDIVIAPAGVAHGFTATGETQLEVIAIHASSQIVTEWLTER